MLLPMLLAATPSLILPPSPAMSIRSLATPRIPWIGMQGGRQRLPSLDWVRTLDTLVTRGLDTVEDALLLARRVTAETVDSINCLDAWEDASDPRPRLLIVGSGWGAHALVKIVDADLYRCLVISPRTFFVFTPMLAASSVGTVEYRSITEPMRASNPRAAFIQGSVREIDPLTRRAEVCIGSSEGRELELEGAVCRSVHYDICVYAAGVKASVSRIPGVTEHCCFLKELADAQRLRQAVAAALERASEPDLSVEERERMLRFVVVGGGPTGVEYCGELSDFLLDAVDRLYPTLVPFARVVLLHGGSDLLPQFDSLLRARAYEALQSRRVHVRLNTRVASVVSPYRLVIKQRQDDAPPAAAGASAWVESTVDCGLIVWAAGTGPTSLTKKLLSRLVDCQGAASEPTSTTAGLATANAAAGAGGRAAVTAIERAEFWARQWVSSGRAADPVTITPVAQDLASGRIVVDPWLRAVGAPSGTLLAIGDASACYTSSDGSLLPQTAQVAAQQGAYVARLLNRRYDLSGLPEAAQQPVGEASGPQFGCELASAPISHAAASGDLGRTLTLRGAVEARPFEFLNLGLLAYLGGGEALSQVQVGENRLLSEAGSIGFLLWRSVYVVKQVSPRTRFLVLFDWFKTKIFGRDVTGW